MEETRITTMITAILTALAIVIFFFAAKAAITGFVVKEKETTFTETIGKAFTQNSTHIHNLNQSYDVKSIRLSGYLVGEGYAKVYLQDKNKKYLIYDSSQSLEGISAITGHAIEEINTSENATIPADEAPEIINETIEEPENETAVPMPTLPINETLVNETPEEPVNETIPINETIPVNETIPINETPEINITPEINKSITINLEYKPGTNWDTDNNGIETTDGVIDITVENTEFNWDINQEKLCTKWNIFSIDNDEKTIICFGNLECCNFLGLQPTLNHWNEPLELYYQAYSSTLTNKITAQVIHYEQEITTLANLSDITYSEPSTLDAIFTEKITFFNDVCIETCSIDIKTTDFELIIEAENITINLNNITYTIKEKLPENNPPVLIANISNITLNKNRNFTLNLTNYFSDPDNDPLIYNYYKTDSISIKIDNNLATLIPDKNFTGTRHTYFTANDTKATAVSNVFEINITDVCEDNDNDGYCSDEDCNDNNSFIYPGASEICSNFIDEDCNGFDKLMCKNLADTIRTKGIEYVKDEVEDELKDKGRSRVIIKLDPNKKQKVKDKISTIKNETKVKKLEKETRKIISAYVTEEELSELIETLEVDDIETIQIDHKYSVQLQEVIPIIKADEVWSQGINGNGQTICVVDTGIDYNHTDLADNYLAGYNFVNNSNDALDDHGHGTYVSGIITGIAPNSKIVAVKVFDSNGDAYESDILAGIDYCINNKDNYSISIILEAFGGGVYNGTCFCDNNLVADESNYAVSQGLFTVAASGDDGANYLKAPSCGANVTSVGSTDDNDNIAYFTHINPILDLLAPGVDVTSTKLGGGTTTRSGSSASAAVVAGTVALLLENEPLLPLDLQYRLRSTGFLIEYNNLNYSRVDAYSALLDNKTNIPSVQEAGQCEEGLGGYKPLAQDCSLCADECIDDYWRDCDQDYGLDNSCTPPYCDCWDICSTGCGADCDSNNDCGLYGTGICNETTCKCAETTDCTKNKCFYVQSSTRTNGSAIFDAVGNLDIKGSLSVSQGSCSAPAKSFIIENSAGTTVAYIDSSGNMCLKGSTDTGNAATCSPPADSFIIENKSGHCNAYIDSSGNLWLAGNMSINASI